MRSYLSMLMLVLLAGCATRPTVGEAPADAEVVATVRHVAGPREAATWIDAAALPSDALRTDAERALLLEVTLPADGTAITEVAPLELANLVIRIDQRDRKSVVVGIDNATDAALAFDLFVSPDGARFRRIGSCPVAARGRAFERWPERTAWIAVAGVRRAAESDASCR
jgi:type IV pilus biogenesis protein CpaD/CtpE